MPNRSEIAYSTDTLADLEARLARGMEMMIAHPDNSGSKPVAHTSQEYQRMMETLVKLKAELICRTHAEQPETEGLLTSLLALHAGCLAQMKAART